MAIQPLLGSILLILACWILIVFTGLKHQPGLGVLGSVLLAAAGLWLRGLGLGSLGFSPTRTWPLSILLGLALGAVIQFLSVVLIEPFSEKVTRASHDHSLIEGVRGNWKAYFKWLLVIWLLVALLEEGIYRGFLITEFTRFAGTSTAALVLNIVLNSAVFGLSHGYQGRSGILSTGIVGLLLGGIFVLDSFNLWLVIFTHGFIDTIGIGLVALGWDRRIQQKFWRSGSEDPISQNVSDQP